MTEAAPRPPHLRTQRVVLRPFDASDVEAVERIVSLREIADTTLSIPHPYPASGAATWIAKHAPEWNEGKGVVFAVTKRDDGALIGAIGLNVTRAHDHAELGYWIAPAEWNKGYATEAAAAIITFGFSALNLHRIHARHMARNPQSGRVMAKLGMRHEGTQRAAMKKWDRYEDVLVYAVLRDDWPGGS